MSDSNQLAGEQPVNIVENDALIIEIKEEEPNLENLTEKIQIPEDDQETP